MQSFSCLPEWARPFGSSQSDVIFILNAIHKVILMTPLVPSRPLYATQAAYAKYGK